MDSLTEPFTTNVIGCARCGLDHTQIEFKPLNRPVHDEYGHLTHWAPCPTNGDPILLYHDAKVHGMTEVPPREQF